MNILKTIIIAFLVLEIPNVAALYFFPETKYANSVGVFKTWEKTKQDPEIHNFVKYLVNWVAGTKLIFILLLIVILISADESQLILTGSAMALATATFFWRLFPIIRNLDMSGHIDPPNYSKSLGGMIAGIITFFVIAIIVTIF